MNAGQTVKMNCKNDTEFHAYLAKQFAKLEKEQEKIMPVDALKQSVIAKNLDQVYSDDDEFQEPVGVILKDQETTLNAGNKKEPGFDMDKIKAMSSGP